MKFAPPLQCPSCGSLFQAVGMEIETCPACAFSGPANVFPKTRPTAAKPIEVVRRRIGGDRTPLDEGTSSPPKSRPFGHSREALEPEPEDPYNWLAPETSASATEPPQPRAPEQSAQDFTPLPKPRFHEEPVPHLPPQPFYREATVQEAAPPQRTQFQKEIPLIPPVEFSERLPAIDSSHPANPLDPSIFAAPYSEELSNNIAMQEAVEPVSFELDATPKSMPKWISWLLLNVLCLGALALGFLKHASFEKSSQLPQVNIFEQLRKDNDPEPFNDESSIGQAADSFQTDYALEAMRKTARRNDIKKGAEAQVKKFVEAKDPGTVLEMICDPKPQEPSIRYWFSHRQGTDVVSNFGHGDTALQEKLDVYFYRVKIAQDPLPLTVLGYDDFSTTPPQLRFIWPQWRDQRDRTWRKLNETPPKSLDPQTFCAFIMRQSSNGKTPSPFGSDTVPYLISDSWENEAFQAPAFLNSSGKMDSLPSNVLKSNVTNLQLITVVRTVQATGGPFWEIIALEDVPPLE